LAIRCARKTNGKKPSPSSAAWHDGSSIYVWYGIGFTRLEEGFDLSDSLAVPAARYDARQFGWFANTSPAKPLVARTDGMLQRAYGGTVHYFSGELSAAPSSNFAIAVRYTRNIAHLPAGQLTADVGSARITIAATTSLVANALVQYNSFENTVAANIRIAYTFRPGSDLFIVLNEQRGDRQRLWQLGDRAALVKLTYLTRF
jgi:hypothetical protein